MSLILVPGIFGTSCPGGCAEAVQADYRPAGRRRVTFTTSDNAALSAVVISNASPALPIFVHSAPPQTKEYDATVLSRLDHRARWIALLVPCRYPIINIRCKVRFDGSILKGPSYPKAAPVSIVTEIRTGRSSCMLRAPCCHRWFCNLGG